MKDEPRSPSRHLLDHAIPTVIHHEDENLPVLARWLKRGIEKGPGFYLPLAGLVVIMIALGVLGSGLSLGRSASDEAWARLALAKDSADRVKVAEEFPETPAARWALLQAATESYNKGFRDLPANRDAALPTLRKALDMFEKVERQSPADSPQARASALGVAQTLEARNDLEKAIAKYEFVAKTWPGTVEAKHADRSARALRKPENVAFYKELYAYKPVEATLPPSGMQGLTLPPNFGSGGLTLPPGHPSVDGPTIPAPPYLPSLPPLGTTPATATPPGTPLPADVFTPEGPSPKADPAKPAAASGGSPPAGPPPDARLPSDVSSPTGKAEGTPKS